VRSLFPGAAANPDLLKIAGPPATDVAKVSFLRLQAGTVDRTELREEFSHFLAEAKICGAAERLKPFGDSTSAEVEISHERGGIEVTTTRLRLKLGVLKVNWRRSPTAKSRSILLKRIREQ
jgi:hypothetical protein